MYENKQNNWIEFEFIEIEVFLMKNKYRTIWAWERHREIKIDI